MNPVRRIIELAVTASLGGLFCATGLAQTQLANVDAGLRQAFERTFYSLKDSGGGVWRGENRAQRLTLEFNSQGARLSHTDGIVNFHLAGYGYGEQLRAPGPARLVGSGQRLEYRRGDLTEWYVNTASGLEQGFTLARRPAGAGGKEPLVIALGVSGGLRLEQKASAVEVGAVLRYAGLTAVDASGRKVPSRIEVHGQEIRLIVDDREARYPLVVDPTWSQQQEVTASDGAAYDQLGYSVAVSGSMAVIGAPGHVVGGNHNQGAAYVFVQSGTTWSQQAELIASDGAVGDVFGRTVAMSGGTAVIGSPYHQVGGNRFQGATYVFVQSGTTWSQQAELTASDGLASDNFGSSVAVSGGTAAIGAPGHQVGDNANQGATYVFVQSGTTWSQQAELTASDGARSDGFGGSVAVSAGTAVIGALGHYVGRNQGAAYVFVLNGTTWSQQAELTASNEGVNDQFGISVAVSGGTAVIGASGHYVGSNYQGAAYVFVQSGTTWSQQAELKAFDGAAFDFFGSSVAVSGGTAVIGAWEHQVGDNAEQGAAYVFVQSGTTWSQLAELTASDGAAIDYFGLSVAVSGGTVVIGADCHQVGSNIQQGAAYMFVQSGTTWSQQGELKASDGAANDHFGWSVAVSGGTAVIGAFYRTVGNNAAQGTAYVFVQSGTTWSQQAELTASDGEAGDLFGWSVAVSGGTAVIGALYHKVGNNVGQGAAYVFVQSGSTWSQQAELTASGGTPGDNFGYSVAVSGGTAVIGAYGLVIIPVQGAPLYYHGSATVFQQSGSTWSQQGLGGSAAGDCFGCSVAVSGGTAVVGAYYHQVGGNINQGAAYVYVQNGTTWSLQAQLTASDGAFGDEFGCSVAVSGSTAVIGASYHQVGGSIDPGAAYVFIQSGTSWTQQAELTASDGAAGDLFGCSVAVSGGTAAIGARAHQVGGNTQQGATYLFSQSGTTWTQQTELTASGGTPGDQFGYSVGVSGGTAVIGAPGHDTAYVYAVPASLSISATHSSPIFQGGPGTITLIASNTGAPTTTAATVSDNIDSNFTINSAPGCSISSQTVTCTMAAGNSSAAFTVYVTASKTAPASISNTAILTDAGDTVATGTSMDSITVSPQAPQVDASLSQLVLSGSTDSPPCVGGISTFTATAMLQNTTGSTTLTNPYAEITTLNQGNTLLSQSANSTSVPPGGTVTFSFHIQLNGCNPFQLFFDVYSN